MNAFSLNRALKPIIIVAVVLLVFGLILSINIPNSLTVLFTRDSALLFFAGWITFSLIFRLRGWKGWLLGLSVVVIFFALMLSFKWTSGFSNNRIIAGLIPYKDQFFYYHGAREVLSGNLIPNHFLQATWRPLFPAFFSNLLFVTGANLKWSLALLTLFSATACYISAREVRHVGGNWGAGLYLILLTLYVNYYIGMTASELAAAAISCLAFALLLSTTRRKSIRSLLAGLILLMISLCMRASAFFIFPFLALWSGWVFRGTKRYSFKILAVTTLVIAISFLLLNTLSQKILVEPGSHAQGNFAYAIYGQAMGGTGYYRAITDIGYDPNLVYKKTLEVIFKNPLSLGIGTFKAYRDFLSPGYQILIPIDPWRKTEWLGMLPWVFILFLYIWGLIKAIRTWQQPVSSFLLATTLGIFLSVPFLPPIDGGARFYANIAPFLLVLPAFGLGGIIFRKRHEPVDDDIGLSRSLVWVTGIILALVVLTPLVFKLFREVPPLVIPDCPIEQAPFQVRIGTDSYVDFAAGENLNSGIVPDVSLEDFKLNGFEPRDDYYQFLISKVEAAGTPMRLFTAKDEIKGHLSFYFGDVRLFEHIDPNILINGCSLTARTDFQTINIIQSINPVE